MAKKLARGQGGKIQEKQTARRRKDVIAAAIVAAAVAGVLVVGYLALSGGPRRTAEGLVARGEQAPAFSVARLGGSGSVSLEELKGRVGVVNFWHSQ